MDPCYLEKILIPYNAVNLKVLTVTCKLLKKQIVVKSQTADYKLNNRIVDLTCKSIYGIRCTAGDDIVSNGIIKTISYDNVDVQSLMASLMV